MAEPKSPRVLCVPINSESTGKSAQKALTGARNAVQGYKRMKRRQLSKARGQLAKLGGLSEQSTRSIQFRKENNISGQGLTTPFKLIKADTLNRVFETEASNEKLDDTFIQELYGYKRRADFVFYSSRSGSRDVFEFVLNPDKPSGVDLTGYIGMVDPATDEGSWLVYLDLERNGRLLPTYTMMGIKFDNTPAGIRSAPSKDFDISKLVADSPIRVHFSDRAINQPLLFTIKNHWNFFNIYPGVSNVDTARINETFNVPANYITESNIVFKPVSERPYGPDFNAIRPPGSSANANYALLANGVSSLDVINFYNKLLRDCWVSIRDSLNGVDKDKFLAYYPTSTSLSLPRGAFDTSSTALWSRVVAVTNSTYEVKPLSYDRRPDDQGNPATSVVDPGPFNAERGLLTDGTALVKSSHRPKGKSFDNRLGSLVIVHQDEIPHIRNLPNVNIGRLAGRVFDQSLIDSPFTKLEYIVRLRVKYASELMYGPYNDFATIASLFRAELGHALFTTYNDNQATMLDTITSANINNNIPRDIFKETWGSLAIRIIMGSKYAEKSDLINYFGSDQPPNNADRLIPFKTPSRSDRIAVYGDIYDVDINGAEIRNYARQDVHGFDFGNRALFRSYPAKRIVIHWGGTKNGYLVQDGGAIAAMLSNTKHSPSTNFTINHEGTVINQHAELAAATGHAYGFNFDSVGIDIPNLGAIIKSYRQTTISGYVGIGYTVINTPLYRYALGKMLIAPINQYETLYQLIVKLCALINPPANIHTDQLRFDQRPAGLLDVNGKVAVAVSSLVGVKEGEKWYAVRDIGGVYSHLHLATNGKTDGIDGYIYYVLRYKGDNSQDAYRRMKLTLQGDVKQTSDGIRYLILNRS